MRLGITLLLVATISAARGKVYPFNDAQMTFSGRAVHFSNGSLLYDWQGTTLSFISASRDAIILMYGFGTARFQITVNGEAHDIYTPSGSFNISVSSYATQPADQYFVSLMKQSEPDFNSHAPTLHLRAIRFDGLYLCDTCLAPKPFPQVTTGRKIEFIGDSLTAGFCDQAGTNGTDNLFTENYWSAYARVAGAQLQAEVHTAAWSGRGLVRNYINVGATMPQLYTQTCGSTAEYAWNFTTWVPDAVFINLGSNDYHSNEPPTSQQYTDGYIAFVEAIAQRYGQRSLTFFAAVGPVTDAYKAPMLAAVQQLQANGYTIVAVDLPLSIMTASPTGCLGHPSEQQQREMAAVAVPIIAKAMRWD